MIIKKTLQILSLLINFVTKNLRILDTNLVLPKIRSYRKLVKLSEEFVNCPRICKFSFENLFFLALHICFQKNYYSREKSTGIKLKADNNATKYLPFCQSDDAKKVAGKHYSLPLIVVMTQFMRLL